MTAIKGHTPGVPCAACRQFHQSLLSSAGMSCLYKSGKGPVGLVAFISTLSLASFLGFLSLLMLSPSSCKKCFHSEDTATHNPSLNLLSAPCKWFRRGSQVLCLCCSTPCLHLRAVLVHLSAALTDGPFFCIPY